MTNAVNIRVLFFGAARDAVEANELDLALEAPATVSSAFQSLKSRFSTLERFGRSLLFAVNQEYATPGTQLKENDELALFPPVRWRGVSCCRNVVRQSRSTVMHGSGPTANERCTWSMKRTARWR